VERSKNQLKQVAELIKNQSKQGAEPSNNQSKRAYPSSNQPKRGGNLQEPIKTGKTDTFLFCD